MQTILMEPSYYESFACLCDKCRNTCCKDWDIDFDKNDYDKLRSKRLPSDMQQKLRECIRRNKNSGEEKKYAIIRFDSKGNCPLINDEGFCSLQLTCGHETLPLICQSYPRNLVHFSGLLMRSCNNSCEETLKLLWEQREGLRFVRRTLNEREEKELLASKYLQEVLKSGYYAQHDIIRTLCIAILQNRSYALPDRLLLLGFALKDLDAHSEESEYIPAWLRKYALLAEGDSQREMLESLPSNYDAAVLNAISNLLSVLAVTRDKMRYFATVFGNLGIVCEDEKISYINQNWLDASARLDKILADSPLFMESLIINHMLVMCTPFSSNGIYSDYLALCNSYAMLRFAMVGFAAEGAGREDIFDGIVYMSRMLQHNSFVRNYCLSRLQDTETNTVAHMVFLLSI